MSPPYPGFWSVPDEIVEQMLALCHPRDVASFSRTCRAAWSFVNDTKDQYLWRQLFLLFPFDDPRKICGGPCRDIRFNWKTELQHRVHAEAVVRSPRSTQEDRHSALVVLLEVVRSASPVTQGYEHIPSPSLLWVMDVLESTNILQVPLFTQQHTCQPLARLRSYLALTLDKCTDEEAKSQRKCIRNESRCRVYSLVNYNKDNDWGPFMQKTGEVDWFHVESIINVMAFNFGDHRMHFMDMLPPRGLEATRGYSAPCATNLDPHDWAGVEGNWRRIVSFMDYRDLFAFNFSIWGDAEPQGASFFEGPNFSEATRLIELKLHLTSPDSVPEYYTLDKFPQSHNEKYPTLYFSGSSKGMYGDVATVLGSVYMADDGVVRWRFVSARESHMQWSSEGVQIGGIASAMGVVGTWTGAHHEHGDPVGKDLFGFGKYQITAPLPSGINTLTWGTNAGWK